jgi:hypothetical protein
MHGFARALFSINKGPTITIANAAKTGILQMTTNVIMTYGSFADLAMVMVEAKRCEALSQL